MNELPLDSFHPNTNHEDYDQYEDDDYENITRLESLGDHKVKSTGRSHVLQELQDLMVGKPVM